MSRYEYTFERFSDRVSECSVDDRLALLVHQGWQVASCTQGPDNVCILFRRELMDEEEPMFLLSALREQLRKQLLHGSESHDAYARAALVLNAAGANSARSAADMDAVEARVAEIEHLPDDELRALVAARGGE